MKEFKSIVAGIDFSDSCLSALRTAGRLAAGVEGSNLQLLHAVTPEFVERYRDRFATPTTEILEQIRLQVEHFARANLPEDCQFQANVFVGHALTELMRAAEQFAADLLVLGSHGLTSGSHSVGGVASKCVRKANVPVLLVRDAQAGAYRKVVAGIDFSEASREALEMAAAIARSDGASLHILHAHCPPWLWASHTIYDLNTFPEKDYEDEYRRILGDQMESFIRPVCDGFADLEIVTKLSEVETESHGLRDYLNEVDADLVVVGSSGRSGLKTLLLGTTAERLVHDSPCSVLTLRSDPTHG